MGGQKTMGVIHGEAFNFVKKNYVVMLVISLIIWAVEAVLGSISSIITAPISGLSSIFGSISTQYNSYSEPGDVIRALAPMFAIMGILVPVSFLVGLAVSIVKGTATIGAQNATLQVLDGCKPTFDGVWKNFSLNWKRYLGITAWSMLWTTLWSLLFIIPGYIKSLSYRFAPYLMIQYPEMNVKDALKKSMEMTNGYKGRLFGLDLILFGYSLAMVLLCCLVLPLLASILWIPLIMYAMYTIAYLDIKQAAIEKGLLPRDTSSSEATY